MEAPVCLIESRPQGKLAVRQEALQVLAGVTQPVVVVAIAGLYRTGKSYLMNRLAGRSRGFPLGSTIQSETKGIWMWCRPHPRKAGHTLVLLDTEGLGDTDNDNEQKDTWIFSLAVLLSSILVYNSTGTIDSYALQRLHYVTELTKHIRVKAEQAGSSREEGQDRPKFVRFFPDFVWAVRDFTLQLMADGKPITEDQYLERALTVPAGSRGKANEVKQCIRDFFPSLKCFTFSWPASGNSLAQLEHLQEQELDSDFRESARRFCNHIWDNTRPMTLLGGQQVTGAALGHLAQMYVDSINRGAVPCIGNAVEALAKIENAAAAKEALACYTERMEQRVRLPTETLRELLELHAQCEREALAVFTGRAFKDDEATFQKQLIAELVARKEEFCRRNEEASLGRCRAALAEASGELERKLSRGSYSVPGGYQRFLDNQKKMKQKYWKVPGKGLKADEVLEDFLTAKEAVAGLILQADQTLTQKEKEMAAERARAKAAKQQQKIAEQLNAEMQQELEALERSKEEHIQRIKKRLEKEKKALMEELQREMDQKLKEHARLMEEEREEEAKQLNQKIREIKEEMSNSKWNTAVDAASTIASIGACFIPGGLFTRLGISLAAWGIGRLLRK
ncbi:guanylate-binding protein 1-like [Carettochelys insculpta]|uniref:guanylate-binding protein 1-like n=1 Tax=Carettochelys insculpta TaxID=44489 RepID=UPI003EB710E6